MAYNSGDEISQVILTMVEKIDQEPNSIATLGKSGMIIQINVSNLDFQFTMNFKSPPDGKVIDVVIGATDLSPDVTVTFKDDHFNEFWQGKLDPMMGMAQGKLKATGNLGKMVSILPALTPVYEMYKESLKSLGKDNLII